MTDLDALAEEIVASSRTLRRAAARGTIRCLRPSERRIVVPATERQYIRRHWPLLGALMQALRTQPNVRLAVMFGSVARGEARSGSDLDLLVRLREAGYPARTDLVERLEEAAGRHIQLVSLDQAEAAPLLLADILRDGRVLVDRDRDWPRLKGRRHAIERRARQEDERLEREAWAVLETLGRADD